MEEHLKLHLQNLPDMETSQELRGFTSIGSVQENFPINCAHMSNLSIFVVLNRAPICCSIIVARAAYYGYKIGTSHVIHRQNSTEEYELYKCDILGCQGIGQGNFWGIFGNLSAFINPAETTYIV